MSKKEQVVVTNLSNRMKAAKPYDRKKFYEEQVEQFLKHWEPSMAVSIVDIILFNESGEMIIQKRSKHKNHNAWLLDKSVWWHVQFGDPIDYTVMVETVEELQCPSIVLREWENLEMRLHLLKEYVRTLAIISHVDTDIMMMKKQMKEWEITIANKVYLYMGVYWWRVKNVDKEAMWLLYYDFDDLLEEIKKYPSMFAYDLTYFVERYEHEIRSFIWLIRDTLSD